MNQKRPNSGLVPLLLAALLLFLQVDAQFFTKSSKSIPRMGRRSDQSMGQLRHAVIDSLVDTYGPDLAGLLRGKAEEDSQPGESMEENEQPLDLTGYQVQASDSFGSRDERSLARLEPKRDPSLAMRALNINRLIEHLASGKSIGSYDQLFTDRSGANQSQGQTRDKMQNYSIVRD